LPLTWRPLPGPPDGGQLAQLNDVNEPLVRALAALLDGHPTAHADDRGEYPQEFARLEAKLDLLFEMIGRALVRQGDVPGQVRLRLSSSGVAWSAEDLPSEAAWVLVRLYLHPRYLQPLEVAGQVLPPGHAQREVTVAFHGLCEPVLDFINKFIFRHHRRVIASHRSPEN
jgi:hypothetical protein